MKLTWSEAATSFSALLAQLLEYVQGTKTLEIFVLDAVIPNSLVKLNIHPVIPLDGYCRFVLEAG